MIFRSNVKVHTSPRQYYYYIQRAKDLHSRNSTHRRQGDLLEMHPCILQDLPVVPDIPVVPDTPETFQAFQSFMTFQPFQAILQCSSISRESTPFQHSPIRMHILHVLHILQFLQFDWFPQKNSTEYQLGNYEHYKHYKHSFFKEREMLRYRSN